MSENAKFAALQDLRGGLKCNSFFGKVGSFCGGWLAVEGEKWQPVDTPPDHFAMRCAHCQTRVFIPMDYKNAKVRPG